MVSTLVGVRLPQPLCQQVETIARAEGYTSSQEFVRETLRERIKAYYREQALSELNRLAGSLKGKKIAKLSLQERAKIAKKH